MQAPRSAETAHRQVKDLKAHRRHVTLIPCSNRFGSFPELKAWFGIIYQPAFIGELRACHSLLVGAGSKALLRAYGHWSTTKDSSSFLSPMTNHKHLLCGIYSDGVAEPLIQALASWQQLCL